jgi:hypothetical protein
MIAEGRSSASRASSFVSDSDAPIQGSLRSEETPDGRSQSERDRGPPFINVVGLATH